MTSTLLRDVPEGPVRDLVVGLVGPTPNRSSKWQAGARGYVFFADGASCTVLQYPGLKWTVSWEDEHSTEHTATFAGHVTWERTG